MATSTSKGVRVAAGIVCAVFAAFVLIHLLWAVGITWGLNSQLAGVGDTEAGVAQTAVSLLAAAAATAAIIVTAALVICFLATIYPSRQAARLDPAAALRYE